MNRILANALLYWAAILALGFVLGAVRLVVLVPQLGVAGAVAAELPVMLGASWLLAGMLLRRRPLPSHNAALAMGALAFALLIASEIGLATQLFGASFAGWAQGVASPAGLLGLAGQVLFAAIPGWRWRPQGQA
jgi:hypothetical protein